MGNPNIYMPMIRVRDRQGRVLFWHLFDITKDEPKLSYDFKLVEWRSPVLTESGRVITFPRGFQLVIRLEVLSAKDDEDPQAEKYRASLMAWQKIFNYYCQGYEIEFTPYSKNQSVWYKVYLSPESERKFYENHLKLVSGVYVLLGKEILASIPAGY